MKLYTGNLSPYSAKVRMQIYAMSIEDIEFELPASFFMGKLSEVSPIGRIPVLEAAEGIIPESEVIAEYLDEMFPERALMPQAPFARAQVRLLSRIADIYLLNNIFMALPQLNRDTRSDAVKDLLLGQVNRGMGALEKHIGSTKYAAGDQLTRADCTLVPALFLCESTVPRFDVENPILATTKVAAYWARIQSDPFAARVLKEMADGLQARLDGSEQKQIKAAIQAEKAKRA